ncbi:MAG: ribulose-phosphate 3-epimerase [Patescibacteria group bacterium]
MAIIVPGILTNDESEYSNKLKIAEEAAELIQIDVVDGNFAKSRTVGCDVIKKYRPKVPLEVQLMVVGPANYISQLKEVDFVSRIIFPLEISHDINECIYLIRKAGKNVGLSLNPETPIESAVKHFGNLDLLLLMTGKPGFSGQKLGIDTYERIQKVKRLDRQLPIEVDIGVNASNVRRLSENGADYLVASSALFGAEDFNVAYAKLAKLAALG